MVRVPEPRKVLPRDEPLRVWAIEARDVDPVCALRGASRWSSRRGGKRSRRGGQGVIRGIGPRGWRASAHGVIRAMDRASVSHPALAALLAVGCTAVLGLLALLVEP